MEWFMAFSQGQLFSVYGNGELFAFSQKEVLEKTSCAKIKESASIRKRQKKTYYT